MMPQGKHTERELVKTKEKRKKKQKKRGPEPKIKQRKAYVTPPLLPLVLEKPTAASLCCLA